MTLWQYLKFRNVFYLYLCFYYKKMRKLLFLIAFYSFSQQKYPQNYFRNPLEIPITLSGTFGEIRAHHFHSGIDIRTQLKEGLSVHAAADGKMTRIKIGLWGYGKALYITHPNGYTTVYAHLKKFAPKIEQYVKKQQYLKQKFEIQLYPKDLEIKKGEIIAYSGSTGGFILPHLHFEIRNTKTENIINPLLFGFKVKDEKPPEIKYLRIYPLNDQSHINKHKKPLLIPIRKTKKNTYETSEILAFGKIGFAINTFDRSDFGHNKNGIYTLEMFQGNKKIYSHTMQTFSFANSKYINLFKDYGYYHQNKIAYQKTFVHPKNKLKIYQIKNDSLNIEHQKKYHFTIKAKDFKGNTATLKIKIQGIKSAFFPELHKKSAFFVSPEKSYIFEKEGVKIAFEKETFYENHFLDFEVKKGIAKVHKNEMPLHKKFKIIFDVKNMPADQKLKSAIVYVKKINKRKTVYNYLKTQKTQNAFTAESRVLGEFQIKKDIKKPIIKKCNFKNHQKIAKNFEYLSVFLDDKESGIASFSATIDNQWILMEYHVKTKKLIYDMSDKKLSKGKHTLKIKAIDRVGNISEFSRDFRL